MTRCRHDVSKGDRPIRSAQRQRQLAADYDYMNTDIGLEWTARFHGTYAEHLRILAAWGYDAASQRSASAATAPPAATSPRRERGLLTTACRRKVGPLPVRPMRDLH